MKRLAQALAGLLAGLLLVELAFHLRHDGAFPHVQCYLPDPELGLRLEPGATQKISFSGNPVTSIRVNAQGLRGADLPPPTEGELIVVGDSQVFGLGVEEEETFSARLAERTGRPVVNAGVPTYGPPEYAAMARRLVEQRSPSTVVFTVNMVNDLFEWNAPNRERHAEWDGWAVRVETAPVDSLDFPGRRFLLRHSHAVFAARALSARLGPETGADGGLPSEGSWDDLVNLEQLVPRPSSETAVSEELKALDVQLEDVQGAISEAVLQERQRAGQYGDVNDLLEAVAGHPGDIIDNSDAEESRDVAVTARLMRQGAQLRNRTIARVAELQSSRGAAIAEAVARGEALEEERQAFAGQLLNRRTPRSVLHSTLAELRDFCEARGVELVVLVLPIDVQVSADEWAKYPGQEPVDMSSSLVLTTDLLEDAQALGLRTLDALPALAAAEPGAFLYGDIHMTATGHAAVADALALALAEPRPSPQPTAGLPEGRSWLPRTEDWLRTPEMTVRGSTRARCETVQIREWVRVTCTAVDGRRPTGVTVLEGDHGEARVVASKDAVTLIAPVFAGESFRAQVHWESYGQLLSGSIGADGRATLAFGEREPSLARASQVSPDEARLCDCFIEVRGYADCAEDPDGWETNCQPACTQMSGGNLATCAALHPDDCTAYLACAEGQLHALPSCSPGSAAAGGGGLCLPLCRTDSDCEEGEACWPWQGTGACG